MAFDSAILRFGGYRFHYNPHLLTVTKTRRLHPFPLADSRTVFQEQGVEPTVITGEGTFIGDHAMTQFTDLEQLLLQPGSQLLGLPELAPLYCYFRKLEVVGKAGPKLLTYRFTFIEDTERSAGLQRQSRFLITERGDTLITVAAKCSITVDDLLLRNPSLDTGRVDLPEGVMLWLS